MYIFIAPMPLMMEKLYDALKAADAPDDKARAAATEAAAFEDRLAKVESDLRLIQWMVGFNLAGTLAILARLLVQTH